MKMYIQVDGGPRVLAFHQQPPLSQIWRPAVFLDPRLRGDDGLRENVIPAQAGIQKIDSLQTAWPPAGRVTLREIRSPVKRTANGPCRI